MHPTLLLTFMASALAALLLGAGWAMRHLVREARGCRGAQMRAEEALVALAAQRREIEADARTLTQANAVLGQASGRFEELYQGLPVPCVCFDRQGRIMEWNRAFAGLYGLDNPLGVSVWEALYQGDGAARIAEAVAGALEGRAQEGMAWARHNADGTRTHLLCSLLPLRGGSGEVIGVISAGMDVTRQHEAEAALRASEERLHALYNTTSQQGTAFGDKVDSLLEMGRAQFGLEAGILARLEGEHLDVIQAHAPGNILPAGTRLRACDAPCAEALAVADAVSYERASATDRRDSPAFQMLGMEAYLGTPVRVDGAVWGTLSFAGRLPHPRPFTSGDRELVRLMAQWIGGEIARRRVEEAVRESEERFRAATAAMSEGLIVMGEGGVIRLWNDSAERTLGLTRAEMPAWQPLNPALAAVRADGSRFPEGSYPLVAALRRGEAQRDVVTGLPRADGGMLWVSVNAKPLFARGESGPPSAVVATFTDVTERRRDGDRIAAQMVQITQSAALLAAQKRQLEEANAQLAVLALSDSLTGLGNRRAFEQRMEMEMSRVGRYGHALSLLLLDVDFFKEYNDAFGHPAGDEVLRALAALLRGQGRDTDFYARYGGEEFIVILPHTDRAGALTVAERLRGLIEGSSWPRRAVTASLGVSTLLPAMAGADELIAEADRALYAAKAAGRNRTAHAADYSPIPPAPAP